MFPAVTPSDLNARAFVIAFAALLTGCAGGAGPSGNSDAGGDVGSTADTSSRDVRPTGDAASFDDAAPANDAAPRGPGSSNLSILSFSATRKSIGRAEVARIELIVGSPAGPDEIAGARLLDTEGNAYGAFSPSSTKATFFFDVSFAVVDGAAPIARWAGTIERGFVAEVFDKTGSIVRSEPRAVVRIGFVCPAEERLCSTSCPSSVAVHERCGGCTNRCAAEDACVEGRCEPVTLAAGNDPRFPTTQTTPCLRRDAISSTIDCETTCKRGGKKCAAGVGYDDPTCTVQRSTGGPAGLGDLSCNAVLRDRLSPGQSARCRCF